MIVTVLRTTGVEETHDVARRDTAAVKRLIGCDLVDLVNLRDGRVMLVDDAGYEIEEIQSRDAQGRLHIENRPVRALKPVNAKATELYLARCKPGTTHQIVGDVAIVNDEDFA